MARILTAREQFEMRQPWLREADMSMPPGLRPGTERMRGRGLEPVLLKPPGSHAPGGDWVNQDWRHADDGGAFHSSVRPPMSSDIPHPAEILDPNSKRHAPLAARAAASEDPENDPWGVLNGTGTSFKNLVDNHMSHYRGMTPEQAYQGRVWYRAGHEGTKELADKTTGDHGRAVATMSAFSPRKAWDENFEQGVHFLTHYDGSNPDFTMPTLGEHVEKAKKIYHGGEGDWQAVNSGPKTSAFQNNLLDPTPMREPRGGEDDDAGYYSHPINPNTNEPDWRLNPDQDTTVDTHHARLQMTPHGSDLSQAKYETPSHFDQFNGVGINGKKYDLSYDLHARASWEATRRLNAAENDPNRHIVPKQAQAGPWVKFKDDVNAASVKRQNLPGPGEPPNSWDPKKKNQGLGPLNNPIPRYQKDFGDWEDPRRPKVDLRQTPNWGRRPTHFQSAIRTASYFGDMLNAYLARHPQHDVSPHLASYFPLAHSESLHRVSPSGEEESYVHSINADTMPPMECPECGLPFDPRELDEHHFLNHGGDLGQVSDQELLGTPWGLGERDMPMHRLNSVQDTLDYVDRLLGR